MVAKDTNYGSETYKPYLDIERIINVPSAGSVNRGHDPLSVLRLYSLVCSILITGIYPIYCGLPVLLPTPSTAWILTTNFWTIRVKGRFNDLMIIDADNECHPNPMFGHEAQVYSRKLDRDIYDPATDSFIGDNIPIELEFTTGTIIFVPAGIKGVGDRQGEGTIENYIGAINEGWI